ncbi:MAG: hypothetical protein R3F56_26555 [Planctomycetota bacterium]
MFRSLAIVGLLSLTSCAASREYFIPREEVRAQSPRGWPAAQYAVTIAGQEVGETKIWSEGTMRVDVDGEDRTVLHVGFEVENRITGELDFDVDRCRVVDVQGRGERFADLGAHEQSGVLHVAGTQVGLIDLEFVLPRGTRPRDLTSFRVEWELATPQGQFKQSTPFRVDAARSYRPRPTYYGSYGYYDPWGPWWGFGTGFAVGRFSSRLWWGPPRWCR